ncbi:MAG: hypothetical protein K9L32_12785 [Chromatiaceae bacterium]|nr:hypothetical protein [Chromatiaceae bacterium]
MSCDIATSLQRMRRAGVQLRQQNGRLIIDSTTPLTDAQITFIREHKPALLEQLSEHRPLTAAEAQRINAWLDRLGEHDLATRAEVLELADSDPEQRIAWLRSAAEVNLQTTEGIE